MSEACFLARFAPAGAEECRGPMQRCHLVTKQRLKALWREVHHSRSVRPREWLSGALPATLRQLLDDPRLWVPGCERHHRLMDSRRSLRVPREAIPGETEAFCRTVALDGWLDREYGEREAT